MYVVCVRVSYFSVQMMESIFFLLVDDGWCAYVSNTEQYLQIDFTDTKRITGLSTIRRQSKPHWVTEYNLKYTLDGETWTDYIGNGFKKVFFLITALHSNR